MDRRVESVQEPQLELVGALEEVLQVAEAEVDAGGISYLVVSDSSIAADYGNGQPPLVITDTHEPAKASPSAAADARSGTLALDGLRGIALLSDGATRIADRYRLLYWPAVLDIISDRGPKALIRRVRQAEVADPDRTRWPRSKTSDDATILWWQLEAE